MGILQTSLWRLKKTPGGKVKTGHVLSTIAHRNSFLHIRVASFHLQTLWMLLSTCVKECWVEYGGILLHHGDFRSERLDAMLCVFARSTDGESHCRRAKIMQAVPQKRIVDAGFSRLCSWYHHDHDQLTGEREADQPREPKSSRSPASWCIGASEAIREKPFRSACILGLPLHSNGRPTF